LDEIQTHARTEFAKGATATDAAKSFNLPNSIGDFHYFRNGFHEIALHAWYKEVAIEIKRNNSKSLEIRFLSPALDPNLPVGRVEA